MISHLPAQSTAHILQNFDTQLANLHNLTLDMVHLSLARLESTLSALHNENCDQALDIMGSSQAVQLLADAINDEILSVLARHHPVANDLRMVIAITRISTELEKLNSEICDIAHLVLALFEPRLGGPNHDLPSEILSMGQTLETMLKKLLTAFWNRRTQPAYALLEARSPYEIQLQHCIQKQLNFAVQNSRMVGRTLNIIEILKAYDHCAEYCKHMAECIIFMIDGNNNPVQSITDLTH